jgi:hypothetical protein
MLNLELCMLTCSQAHRGVFHGHLRDMVAHLKTLRLSLEPWRLTLEPWRLTVEPCMLTQETWRLTLKPCMFTWAIQLQAHLGARDAHTEPVESRPEDIEAHPGAL